MMKRNIEKELVMDCVKSGDMGYAEKEIRVYCIDLTEEYIDSLSEDDLLELFEDEYDIHPMSELDNVFRHLSVTEVLEELSNIDLSNNYFTEGGYREVESGDDPWELIGAEKREVAESLFDGEIYWEDPEMDEIKEKYDALICEVMSKMEIYRKAKRLFEIAMDKDPSAVIATLWNMEQA